MGFDKNKTKKAAERYLSQGKINAAIKEYKKVVKNDPDDVNTQNMLGDLYVKAEDKDAAIKCYQSAADYYNSNGFEKKAIAVYNKVLKLDAESPEISLRIAELYRQRGALAEARKHYETVASHHENSGDKAEALAIWEKIADIDPKNTEIYLKMADYYGQNDQPEEAASAFIEGGSRLAEVENHVEAAAAFSRALELVSDELDAVRGYVQSQVHLGYPEEAIKILDEIYERDPHNADVVFLLCDCFLDLEDPEKAEEVVVDLVTKEPKAYAKLLDLVEFYMKKDDLEAAVRVLSLISEQLLVSQKPERLLELLNEVIARNPEQIQALRLLARYYSWHKDEYELERALEQLADAAKLNESVEDERYAITQLLLISPQENKHISRLKEINESHGSPSESASPDSADQADGVPTFESFNGLLNGNENEGQSNGSVREYTKEDFEEAEITLTEADLQAIDTEVDYVTESGLDVGEQIENLKFYIEQGYVDIADQTIKELDEEHGVIKEFDEIRTILKKIKEFEDSNDSDDQSTLAESGFGSGQGYAEHSSMPEDDRWDIGELDQGTDELSEIDETESEPEPEEAIAQDDAEEETEEQSVELEEESEEAQDTDADVKESEEAVDERVEEVEEEAEEVDSAVEEPAEEEAADGNEEYETSYHHAVAYKEMGLLEDAIREFKNAFECLDADDGTGRYLQCCTLLAHCYMEQNSTADAIDWFEKAFEVEELSEDEVQALNYELASALVSEENYEKAQGLFEKIQAVDPDYRDVASRLEECREKSSLVTA